ncbi:aminotransferase class I/II-fold pyridoxal phosphate-dependent enzyme [Robertmurraya sp.]|uniref:aminotransferase class I/II-fold pyridoxal phosphate-dependent enzyme n=1 Tax=Robertmurraya sp. TaxID=2837525 RepID=UPI003703C2F2
MNQKHTPLYDALIKHKNKKAISFHVPGHKNGEVFLKEAHPVFQNILNVDVTELSGLDDLHSPSEAILEAETLLANYYEVKKSFFLINGSTVGNLAMILSAVSEGDEVLVQRNCHKSIMNGLSLANVKPIFIAPEFDTEWQVAGGITLNSIKEAVKDYPQVKALIVTYPNYYGMVTNLKEIITFCHERNIIVLVDEAHGAHFKRSKGLPMSATELGADVVVQSAHKTLPAMTMGSYLHYNSERVDLERVKAFLRMLQSSSPSYPIMASLDLARKYIATYEEEDLQYTLQMISQFRDKLNRIPSIKLLSYKGEGDPLKITIQSRTALTGFALQSKLEEYGIFTELADEHNVLFIFPLLKRGDLYPIEDVWSAIVKGIGGEETSERNFWELNKGTSISTLQMSYKEQQKKKVEIIPLSEANGRVCAESIIPYPPGIPLLLPGELIKSEDIKQIHNLLEAGSRFQGGENIKQHNLKVFHH